MGFLSKSRKKSGENLYESQIKPKLVPKDGHTHVMMIGSFSKFANQAFGVETKYNEQVGTIIDSIQNDGYEIVDIKFNVVKDHGIAQTEQQFYTLIMYK